MQRWAWCAILFSLPGWGADNYTPAERRHWAYQPRKEAAPPAAGNPVDAFITARLKEKGLRPAARADARVLVRRANLDVTGLPPTPEEVERFARNPTQAEWEQLVDRLLASQGYAERQAQQWLDVIRYADTDGFEYDTFRPDAWRFRDFVIASFSQDKPFDQFIREQLAGDELDPDRQEFLIAAGFQRLGPLRKNAGNQEVASSRNEVLVEMTNIVGSAFLGQTVGCARCHDHKFDPIRQKDYYRMQAFFASTHEKDVPLAPAEQQAAWEVKKKVAEAAVKQIQAAMKGLTGAALEAKKKELEQAEAQVPEPLPALYSVMSDTGTVTPVHVLVRGDWNRKGDEVGMRTLGVLLEDPNTAELPVTTPGPRKRLAEWVTRPDNPLTARVLANRIWLWRFGRGLVATPNDFGRMGTRPTHPELLDYLANELVKGGWRLKPLHRMILVSNTYQQASDVKATAKAEEEDPGNTLWWKYDRRRLDAEQIRDSMLAVAGVLNPKSGGPPITVPLDPGLLPLLYKPSQWKVTEDMAGQNRRSLYLLQKRNMRLPMLEVFDQADRAGSCPQRESSTHAPQALELMNGTFANQMSHDLAARLDREAGGSAEKMVDRAFRLATGQAPNAEELRLGVKFLAAQPASEFALAVLNLNDFLYVR
jgi:hypothetical protein